jgi:hypothetical protein
MAKSLADQVVLDLPEDKPIVLVGQPGAMRGEFHLKNPGTERLVLRGSQLHGTAQEGTAIAHTLPPVVLRPGARRRVPLKFQLPPHTPPGEYQVELEAAGRAHPVLLHVTEVVRLDVAPAQVVIENDPGAKVVKRVVFSNQGNVPLTVGHIGAVPLDDDLLECRVGRAAYIIAGDQVTGLDDFFAELVRQTKAALEQSGVLRVRNLAGTVVLQPGDTRAVELEVRVPKGLNNRSRYRGVVALYTTDLEFVIVPSPGEAEPESEPD